MAAAGLNSSSPISPPLALAVKGVQERGLPQDDPVLVEVDRL
jgi:hypothetical protein